jgi:P-type Cu+ transporter
VGWISLALAVPVLLFSAQDYFKLAWQGLKRRFLTIEAPIAAGIVVIFGQSAWEVLAGKGVGYFDSFAGLLFFLLCGRMFQQKSYARLAFDRDFKSFFPLSVARRKDGREEHVSLSAIETGDRLLIRNGELVPADARLVSGDAVIDYSFVTGEAEHVALDPGDYLYAGGRQMGPAIEIETLKPVSQSYLTSLWNQDVFKKPATDSLDSLINRYSQRFTKLVVVIALAAAAYWAVADPSKALFAATSVLIVACPCALALAAPFALGTALRALGKIEVFVKSPDVVERMAKIDSVVFDKTGTLTACGAASVEFKGLPLLERTRDWLYSMTRHSTHPHAAHIGQFLRGREMEVRSFVETPGCGMAGMIDGHDVWIGSAAWLASNGVGVPPRKTGSASHVAIDGDYRGVFLLPSAVRTGAEAMIGALRHDYNLALLSGDHAREQERFQKLFGATAVLRFEQSPLDKLDFVRELQGAGKRALMVGDGLNDAGALEQSDVGVAVVETIGCFSPASDIIMRADNAPRLDVILRFSKDVSRIVKLSFGVSTLYNVVGVSIAASAKLAPIVCAILMPLSSITVVAFACGAVSWQARKRGLTRKETR